MKSRTIALMSAIAVMALAGCTNSTSPVSSDPNNTGGVGSDRQIDQSLDKLNPELRAWTTDDGGYDVSMMVGIGGMPESAEFEAVRGIRNVEFQFYSPDRERIDFRSTDDIISSGIARNDGFTSLTITANVHWVPSTTIETGSFAVMTIHTDEGVVERSSMLPAEQ